MMRFSVTMKLSRGSVPRLTNSPLIPQAELRSLLDETTILSIAGDYDLADPAQLAAVREVLLTIAKDVPLEEATGFNPSGLGPEEEAATNGDRDGHHGRRDGSSAGGYQGGSRGGAGLSDDGLTTASTATTTTTEGMAALSLDGASSPRSASVAQQVGDIFDGLTAAEKEQQLQEMFTSLKLVDVRLALKKAGGDAGVAIDSLLNLQWLEQTGQRVKGVDGFYLSGDEEGSVGVGGVAGMRRKKQGKRKGKKQGGGRGGSRSEPQSPRSPGSPAEEEEFMDDEQHDGTSYHVSEHMFREREKYADRECSHSEYRLHRGEAQPASV